MAAALPNTQPSAHEWVMRDQEGRMVRIKVTDMTDQHLMRWVQYFRRKYRERNVAAGAAHEAQLTDDVVDARLKASMVTAPAIYAEAAKRGVTIAPTPGAPVKVATPTVAPGSDDDYFTRLDKAYRDAMYGTAMGPPNPVRMRPVPGQRKITLDEE